MGSMKPSEGNRRHRPSGFWVAAFLSTRLVLAIAGAAPALAQEPAAAPAPVPKEPVVYVCPMHPDVASKLPGKCQKCGMSLVASVEGQDATFYACPMHPDVQSGKPDKCPKCGMALVKMAPPEVSDYQIRLETTPAAIKPGEKALLRFTIFHPRTDEQVKKFNLLHDMPFHLFLVSQDFSDFQHIHPEQQQDGSFTIEAVLERPGHYKVFCDFFPDGGTPQVVHQSLTTAGYRGDLAGSQPQLAPDKELVKTLDGIRFELKLDPERPVAGKPALLKYRLVDDRTNLPVKDLRPYLGAWGHTLILSADATDYLHSHPAEMIPEGADRAKLAGGPEVSFDTFFPRPGHYRIWSQFQRGEKLTTVSFTIYVPRMQ